MFVRNCLLAASLLIWLFSPASYAQNKSIKANYQAISDDDFVIINIKINGASRASDVEAYWHQQHLLLPLGLLNDRFGFNITLDKNRLSYQPNDKTKNFTITLVEPANQLSDSNETDWRWTKDDFDYYIDANILTLLFQAEYQFDYSLLQVTLTSQVALLPDIKQSLPTKQVAQVLEPNLLVDDQYQWFTYPIINYNLRQQFQQSNNNQSMQLNAFFDVAKQSAEFKFNQNNGLQTKLLKFSKQFNKLNTDNFWQYQLGDIQTQSDNLIHNPDLGLGVHISNKQPNQVGAFKQITITENALEGWRAELYRNGQFITQTDADNNNQVQFDNIDTFYGNNVFDIKLFGPQGQQITKQRSYRVTGNQLVQGQWQYDFALVDNSARLLDTIDTSQSYQHASQATLSYGLTNRFTLDVAHHWLNFNEQSQQYLSSALHGVFANNSFNVEFAKSSEQGWAAFSGVSGQLNNTTNYRASLSHFSRFISARHQAGNSLKQSVDLALSGVSNWFDNTSWSFQYSRQQHIAKANRDLVQLRMSKSLYDYTLANNLIYDTEREQSWLNQTFWTFNHNNYRVTQSIEWYPRANKPIERAKVEVRWPQLQQLFQRTQLSYQANNLANYQLSHQITWRTNHYNLQFSSQVDDLGDWQISAALSGTLGFDHLNNRPIFTQPQALNAGQIEAQVFIDQNRNLRFDQGDQPLDNIEFEGNYNWQSIKTNAQGLALLPSSYNGQLLYLSNASLPDPFMQPEHARVLLQSHKGGVTQVELPLLTMNDIEGSVYITDQQISKPAAQQTVQLLDASGEIVAQTTTAYDGYYLFNKIPPGNYRIAISSDLISQQQLIATNLPEQIVAPNQGDAIILPDIVLAPVTIAADMSNQPSQHIENKLVKPIQTTTNLYAKQQDNFFIQLGIYNHLESIFYATRALPAQLLDIQIFYNEQRQRFYLVAGPYQTPEQAQPWLNKVQQINQYQHAFLIRSNRYADQAWELRYQLHHLAEKLSYAKQKILKAANNSYFCQLAAYRSINSVDMKKFSLVPDLLIAKRQIKQHTYYTFLLGPYPPNSPNQCDAVAIQNLTPEQPFKKPTKQLLNELAQ